MTVYTSNYARHGENPLAIAISRKTPDWYTGEHLEALAPTWDMVINYRSGKIDEAQYAKEYLLKLKKRGIDPNWITTLPEGTLLLCYEKPTDFCHRHLLSMWVESKTGVVIPEWKNEKEKQASAQEDLVDDLFGL